MCLTVLPRRCRLWDDWEAGTTRASGHEVTTGSAARSPVRSVRSLLVAMPGAPIAAFLFVPSSKARSLDRSVLSRGAACFSLTMHSVSDPSARASCSRAGVQATQSSPFLP